MQTNKIKEQALVISKKDSTLKVVIHRPEACMHCPAKGVCSTLSSSHGKDHEASVIDECSASIGDIVQIEIPEKNVLLGATLIYFFPAVFLLFGAILGNAFSYLFPFNENVSSMLGAVTFFSVSLIVIFVYSKLSGNVILPRAVKIIESSEKNIQSET